jgi:uncharacterized cofD-like protein
MKEWPFRGQGIHLKWLRPGMGVKRWVLLLAGGLALLGLAVIAFAQVIDFSPWLRVLQRLSPSGGPVGLALLSLVSGATLIGLAVFGLNRSLLSAYRRSGQDEVVETVYRHRQRQRGPKVAALGGGHGLNTLLRGLKEYTDNITAIVTVADDGGSSGRLRREMGMLPPGDFRNCIAALSDSEGLVSQLFQYRFGDDSELAGHSFGNLYLTAMTAITGSFESALEESSRVLAVRGRVIPSTLMQVTLCAERMSPVAAGSGAGERSPDGDLRPPHGDLRLEQVCGESSIGEHGSRIERVYLDPENPPAYPAAIRAILDADLIVIGPGSLYTSVMPNLLVPDLMQAIFSASAVKVFVCSVATQTGETEGYDVTDYVEAIRRHVGADPMHWVLANETFLEKPPPGPGVGWVGLPPTGGGPEAGEPLDYRLARRDLLDSQYPWRHDPAKLAAALMELLVA